MRGCTSKKISVLKRFVCMVFVQKLGIQLHLMGNTTIGFRGFPTFFCAMINIADPFACICFGLHSLLRWSQPLQFVVYGCLWVGHPWDDLPLQQLVSEHVGGRNADHTFLRRFIDLMCLTRVASDQCCHAPMACIDRPMFRPGRVWNSEPMSRSIVLRIRGSWFFTLACLFPSSPVIAHQHLPVHCVPKQVRNVFPKTLGKTCSTNCIFKKNIR